MNHPTTSLLPRPIIPAHSGEVAYDIENKYSLSPLASRMLAVRGFVADARLEAFLHPRLARLEKPETLADYEKAVSHLAGCVTAGEPIGVFGDYDTDGISSVSLWVLFFRAIGLPSVTRLAHRDRGYGLTIEDVRFFAEAGVRTVIACDVGSTDHEAVEAACALGLELVIVDHHHLQEPYPKALALINPLRADCHFPFPGMASVGLSFYLMAGLRSRLEADCRVPPADLPELKDFLDIVALGTLADVSPLTGNNRILVHHGLRLIAARKRPALRALCVAAHIDPAEELTEKHVVFRMTPKLNAPGRMGDAELSLQLLTAADYQQALVIAGELTRINERRQQIQEQMFKEAVVQAEASMDYRWGIVVSGTDWHPGIVGIVAAKLAEQYKRPAIAIALRGDIGRGSVRTFGAINIFEVIRRAESHLRSYGGHQGAMGIELAREQLGDFARAFDEQLRSVASTDPDPAIPVDAQASLHELNARFLEELKLIAPFGNQNPEPVLLSRDLEVLSVRFPKNAHVSVRLRDPVTSAVRQAIGFNMARAQRDIGSRVHVIYVPERNAYNPEGIQMRILVLWNAVEGDA